jgi:hypothetical protein
MLLIGVPVLSIGWAAMQPFCIAQDEMRRNRLEIN